MASGTATKGTELFSNRDGLIHVFYSELEIGRHDGGNAKEIFINVEEHDYFEYEETSRIRIFMSLEEATVLLGKLVILLAQMSKEDE